MSPRVTTRMRVQKCLLVAFVTAILCALLGGAVLAWRVHSADREVTAAVNATADALGNNIQFTANGKTLPATKASATALLNTDGSGANAWLVQIDAEGTMLWAETAHKAGLSAFAPSECVTADLGDELHRPGFVYSTVVRCGGNTSDTRSWCLARRPRRVRWPGWRCRTETGR